MQKDEKLNSMAKKVIYSLLMIFGSIVSVFGLYGQGNSVAIPVGGKTGFRKFVEAEMQYPKNSLINESEAKVRIQLIVHPDGEPAIISVQGTQDTALIAETKRLINRIVWVPAVSNGIPTQSLITTGIEFNVKKYHRYVKRRGYETLPCVCESCDSSHVIYKGRQLSRSASPVFDKDTDFTRFLKKNLKYPEAARKQNLSGTVKLTFVIEPYGSISNIHVVDHLGMGCTEEAIRVLQLLKWNPAVKGEVCVRSLNSVSISFGNPSDGYRYMPVNQFNSIN